MSEFNLSPASTDAQEFDLNALVNATGVQMDVATFSRLYSKLEYASRLATTARVLLVARALEQGMSEKSVLQVIIDHSEYYDSQGHFSAYRQARARESIVIASKLGSSTLEEVVRRGGMSFEQLRELAYVKDNNVRTSLVQSDAIYHLPSSHIAAIARDITLHEYMLERARKSLLRAIRRAKRYGLEFRDLCNVLKEGGYEIC